jgi:Phage integrase family
VKEQHSRALKDSGVAPFVPYVLRHTALTRLAKSTNGDVFALARIAGHSSITITQRYVHPQAETIEGIFARAALSQSSRQEKAQEEATKSAGVGKKLGTASKSAKRLIPSRTLK